ncbi:N-substituted formamide deformylase precursor [Microbulbifer aggregans]|uniref:N-substituted formamide deformylase n=1 Tax=Microbulbifer aggregans TaxID=1769779 RepID=A0A1C9W8U2_9GAMM|nr:amidohydrolase [Microbulbifer aggregans]AOS97587.1 N-substituted formamide deformylase precursor [Microbulbifer aggregans]
MPKKKVTVFTARTVRTMDPGRPVVDAVAVLDGKVLSTGTMESMQPWLAHYDVTVDDRFKDKVIMPGFIEPHSHCWMSAGFMALPFVGPLAWPSPTGMNQPLETVDAIVDYLKELDAKEKDPKKPIFAWGYDAAKQGAPLDRKILDKVSTTRPVYILAWAPHFIYLNTPALALSKVPTDSKDPHIQKYDDGSLNGVLAEPQAVTMAMTPVLGQLAEAGGLKGLYFLAGVANRAGVTTVADLAFGALDWNAELKDHQDATSAADFPLRIRLTPIGLSLLAKHGDKAVDVVKDTQKLQTDRLFIDAIKFWSDGSYPLLGSLVNFPGYLDGSQGQHGDANMLEAMKPFWKAGYQIHTHANGDMAIDITLDALAELQKEHPRFDHRFSVEHYSMSNPMQARRLKALGGVASVNVYFIHYRSLLHRTHAYGPDRAETVARLSSLEREGVTFAFHSDYPQVVVPMLPLSAVAGAVTRIAEDGKTVIAPDEAIGVERALRAITIDAAYILGLENKIGSLEQGKFADFTILEEDPFEVDPVKIEKIRIWGTVLGGKPFQAKPI